MTTPNTNTTQCQDQDQNQDRHPVSLIYPRVHFICNSQKRLRPKPNQDHHQVFVFALWWLACPLPLPIALVVALVPVPVPIPVQVRVSVHFPCPVLVLPLSGPRCALCLVLSCNQHDKGHNTSMPSESNYYTSRPFLILIQFEFTPSAISLGDDDDDEGSLLDQDQVPSSAISMQDDDGDEELFLDLDDDDNLGAEKGVCPSVCLSIFDCLVSVAWRLP
jgi:hypothetical protein